MLISLVSLSEEIFIGKVSEILVLKSAFIPVGGFLILVFRLMLGLCMTTNSYVWAGESNGALTRIDLHKPLSVVNQVIFKTADSAISKAIESLGAEYKFEKLSQVIDLEIVTLHKDCEHQVHLLELQTKVYVGGYAWFEGYQRGWVSCKIQMSRGELGDWSWDGSNSRGVCDFGSLQE